MVRFAAACERSNKLKKGFLKGGQKTVPQRDENHPKQIVAVSPFF
jgi:hypothetical protein